MDWRDVLTTVGISLFSSAIITSAILYVLKQSFDRSLDFKFSQLLEKSKLEAQEEAKRKSKLFEKQAEAYQEMLSTVYRLRNLARELSSEDKQGKEKQKLLEDFITSHLELQDQLYHHRAILPDSIFHALHQFKTDSQPLITVLERLQRKGANGELHQSMLNEFRVMDVHYQLLVDLIQPRLGVITNE